MRTGPRRENPRIGAGEGRAGDIVASASTNRSAIRSWIATLRSAQSRNADRCVERFESDTYDEVLTVRSPIPKCDSKARCMQQGR